VWQVEKPAYHEGWQRRQKQRLENRSDVRANLAQDSTERQGEQAD